MYSSRRLGFTLIELLVVIAIIAILAVVVVLTLNPAELLRQSRDANRISDMATLGSALNLYVTDQSGASSFSLGTASTSYLSFADQTATSTLGDQCQGLGMPSSGYLYGCAATSTWRSVNSQGWVPVGFTSLSSGAPFSSLPVDPVDQTSSDLYYAYQTNGLQYQVTALAESQKYAKQSTGDGGSDPSLLEEGSGASVMPDLGRGLAGYWPLNEGQNSTAIDWSGNGKNGSWLGTATGTSGYYSQGYIWSWAGTFDGSSTKITASITNPGQMATYLAWVYPLSGISGNSTFLDSSWNILEDIGNSFDINCGSSCISTGANTLPLNTWTFAAVTDNNGAATLYVNGVAMKTGSVATTTGGSIVIGSQGSLNWFKGYMSDVRVYDRVLSSAEIQEIYNTEK